MKKLKLKINDWNGTSLIVTAIGDTSEKDFDRYASHAYQPAFFDVQDVNTLIKQIAKSCVSSVESNEKLERFSKNKTLQEELSKIVGNVYEWEIGDLYSDEYIENNESNESDQTITRDIYSSLTVEEKLELAGISIEELKEALGLSN